MPQQERTKLAHKDYTVGWICALPIELVAARAMLDEHHDSLPQDCRDHNNYSLGRIGAHNVAIACLPEGVMGVTSAARVAEQMLWTFDALLFRLMVGIGGGAPNAQNDIRLGDVVVSRPEGPFGGVIQYDYGKTIQEGRFERTGSLNRPPDVLLRALASVKAAHMMEVPAFWSFLSEMADKFPRLRNANAPSGSSADQLFEADYDHVVAEATCARCRVDRQLARAVREESGPRVHYGLVASGNQVMKDGKTRERLRGEANILCFEMEAAGLMDSFPCLVIRGICDYADTHKNKEWQPYAAATAAAYAKELLKTIPGSQIEAAERATHATTSTGDPGQDINIFQTELLDKTEQKCLHALYITDPQDDRQRLIDEKGSIVEGTCEWILGNSTYRSWLTAPHSKLLWLSGGPGKGKSMISVFLTEQLAKSVHQSKQAILAYYFCENKDHKRNTATAILRGLILQLLRQRRDLFKCILPDFQIREEKLFTSDTALQALWKIFANMLLRLKQHTIFCILDGLDECEEKSLRTFLRNLNQFFSKVNNPSIGAFKLVAASRDNPQCIRQELSAFARLDLDSEGLQNELSSDIEKYIHFKSRELSDRKCYSEDLRNTVEGVLLNGADGTFLWVSLVCDELEQKLRSEARETLRCLPRGLDAIYGRILLQVEERYRDTVAQVLRWITVAVRPLTLRELSAATNTTDEILRDVIESCRPLLRADGGCVNFLHQSAKDYLLRETPDPDPRVDYFRVSKAEANLELAQACFRYIQSGPYAEGPAEIQELSYCSPADTERLRKFPLMRYATYHWSEHSRCSPASVESVFDLSQPFFQTDSFVRQAWWETYWDATGDLVPKDFTPMHVASFCGLVILAQKLQKDWKRRLGPNPLHARDSHGKTPLHWAAYNGYKELTRLLLKKGADPEAKDTERAKQTALHFAADNGHEAVVGLLLDFGANVNSQDKNEWTALHSAAQSGHEAVARLLLEKAADLDAREGDGRTALHFAAECGHEAIARLLIEGGADLEAEDDTGGVALHEAAANGDKAIVQLLLDKGADIEAWTMDGESALCFAAKYGYETIVRLLLEKGANPNYEADRGKAVLLLAAANGQQAVVRLLLERDDVDPNYYGEIALLSAAKNGHESVVRLLLERDIFQGSKDWLAIAQIYNAVKAGQESLVQLLLENDSVDSNQKDSSGRMLLSWAASTNCSAVVKLLLERGRADPESKDRLGCTPLWHAVNHNRESVVRLLLEAGADPESKSVYGSSPLSLTKNGFRDGLVPILKQYARTRRRAC